MPICLSKDQQNAADEFLNFIINPEESEMTISGHSGTGKTFLTQYLVKAAESQIKLLKLLTNSGNTLNTHFTATTNKAAKVLANTLGEETKTIHSLLGLKVMNNFNTGKTTTQKTGRSEIIYNSIIFVDECSMMDSKLLSIIREMTVDCKLVFIGDPYQLAPVFETTIPAFTQVTKQVKLTEIQRQAKGNPIIELGDKLRKAVQTGVFPKLETVGDAITVLDGAEFQERINNNYSQAKSSDEHKILAWTNDRVHDYNDYVRERLVASNDFLVGETLVTNNPILDKKGRPIFSTDSEAEVTAIEEAESMGVQGWNIQLDHQVTVFLAKDPKEVKRIMKHLAREAKLDSSQWKNYFAAKDAFADLRPVHASTVHKSQGSTYNRVFVDLADIGRNNRPEEVARLLYVAITRAKTEAVLYGELPLKYQGA
jgi:exodeoxyribonuclease-5